jgi:hypothetical protein
MIAKDHTKKTGVKIQKSKSQRYLLNTQEIPIRPIGEKNTRPIKNPEYQK